MKPVRFSLTMSSRRRACPGGGKPGPGPKLFARARNWAPAFAGVTAVLMLAAGQPAHAQSDPTPTTAAIITGTLAKVEKSGTITIGYRESSIPFSYLSVAKEPIGYSIDLCRQLVDAIGEVVGRNLLIRFEPVTSDTRIAAVTSGKVDLECGSTTSNLERQKQVAFSPTMFVSGTKLLVKKGSPVKSYRDLVGKKVVVTSGTTNEKTLQDLKKKFNLNVEIVASPDHAASFKMLADGQVDAFATDDVLLYGLIAQNNVQRDYVVAGDFLSYDPYGVMYRKGEPALAKVIEDAFQHLAEDREIDRRYTKWFLRKLPSSTVSLDLPMSPQLETILQAMAVRPE
jgi:ABC-type amino acid transport substrate-binding protein